MAFVTPRYASRSNTTWHHPAAVVGDAQDGDGTPERITSEFPGTALSRVDDVFGKNNATGRPGSAAR
jgi:hypothetical protein